MHSSKKDLLAILDAIRDVQILVVGDLILDRYIWGEVDRISPEAPVPIVDVRRTEDRLGGAANVARNLRGVGCQAAMCGFIGDDDEGKLVLKLLEQDGVGREGVMIDRGRPTCLKTRLIAQRQQMIRIDRESRQAYSPAISEGFAAVVDSQIDASRAVILSDYGKGCVGEALMRRLSAAHDTGRIGLGLRPLVVDPHPRNYDLYHGITVAKPNRKEAEAASGMKITDRESGIAAGQKLVKRWDASMVVVTLGEGGMVIVPSDGGTPLGIETVAREVFDVSGAGDTVTALFTAALSAGASAQLAGDLANVGAGVVVSEVGTSTVTTAKLRSEIERLAREQGDE